MPDAPAAGLMEIVPILSTSAAIGAPPLLLKFEMSMVKPLLLASFVMLLCHALVPVIAGLQEDLVQL